MLLLVLVQILEMILGCRLKWYWSWSGRVALGGGVAVSLGFA